MDSSKFPSGIFISTLFLLIVFLIPLVVSADLLFPYNRDMDIKRPCFNNGTFCSSSAVCNITVSFPGGQGNLIDNQIMSNQDSFHNYTSDAGAITRLGEYSATMMCTDTGGDISGSSFDTFTLEVTGDGLSTSPFPIQFSLLALGIILIFVGKIREDWRFAKHVGAILTFIIGVITIYPGYSGLNSSSLMGLSLGTTTIGLGFYFLIEDVFSRDRQVNSFQQDDSGRDEDDGRFHGND